MQHEMDVLRFIAEVKNRPILWDVRFAEHNDRKNTPQQWQEIADILRVDIKYCKRKWKNLRDAYRAEVRRTERRIERCKSTGEIRTNVASKWAYFEPMSFINESKRAKYSIPTKECNSLTDSNLLNEHNDMTSSYDIKMEGIGTTDEDEQDDDLLFERFNSVAAPRTAGLLSDNITNENITTDKDQSNCTSSYCKCSKRTEDQVHFLKDLEREEQKLMQSTRLEMTNTNNLIHIGDSDYNFLVSFLPQMKKMNELQNLQFRAKMCDLLLNTMTASNTSSVQPISQILKNSDQNSLATSTTEPIENSLSLVEQHIQDTEKQQKQEFMEAEQVFNC